MKALTDRFNYLFRSTKGLILVAIALIAIVTAAFGMLSGPLKEWGISDVAIKLYGMKLVEAEREAASSCSITPSPCRSSPSRPT